MNVTDFTKNDGCKDFADPGNRMEYTIEFLIVTANVFRKLRQLVFQKVDLSYELAQFKSQRITS